MTFSTRQEVIRQIFNEADYDAYLKTCYERRQPTRFPEKTAVMPMWRDLNPEVRELLALTDTNMMVYCMETTLSPWDLIDVNEELRLRKTFLSHEFIVTINTSAARKESNTEHV